MDNLHEVDAWLDALLAKLEPAERKRMLREVARDMRRIQQANMTAQRAPDGNAWEPRRVSARTKSGRIKRKMFVKLKTAKYLKTKATGNSAEVAFVPAVQRLARVHHYGLRDKVSKRGNIVKYSERPLMGINAEVQHTLQEHLINWLKI
ncbi:phage virion morphogenesis protein [Pantoea ananatis]|uniref:phage virion morphogenesis protein n=1 Tax=Pantoea ananas TaxID=553 RepID=UPI00091EE587|nr:phage virion morphogenesis protein [Pantoea ananatis]SFX90451.1 phage virion morphogenesis (putative tail completion) protein [Pantoea ananatis]